MASIVNTKPYAISYWSLPIAVELAFLPHQINSGRNVGKVDLGNPRDSTQILAGNDPLTGRLSNAHKNGLEALSVYSVAMLAAMSAGVDCKKTDTAALVWLLSRASYITFFGVGTPERKWAHYGRIGSFLVSLGTSFYLLIEAAKKAVANN
mmetsp:Transcript_12523/g.18922  ORF Transcript_12523/g.18922 Transcript_12523/m.18922 type:complete len:151 (+) Transcript_12523:122-574(+)